jgi:hypothetical protein
MPTTIHYVDHLDASRDTVQFGDGATYLSLKHRFGARRFVEKLLWHSMGRHYRMDRDPALLADFAFSCLRVPRLMDW